MKQDAFGNLVINPEYNAEMLAEAVCKLMGYAYAPNEQHYWQHGHSSERDFVYVTTAALSHEQLRAISEEVGAERTLLICCKAFRANADAFENLTVRKIPQAVLSKCEWGRDDYSLRIASLPDAPPSGSSEAASGPAPRGRRKKQDAGADDLFAAKAAE